jgi:FAD/FMN-containing dehydrogenase
MALLLAALANQVFLVGDDDQAYYEALRTRAIGVYSNFLEVEGEARIHEAYPELTYRRLARVKRDHDPNNLFRLNQNIRPAAAS